MHFLNTLMLLVDVAGGLMLLVAATSEFNRRDAWSPFFVRACGLSGVVAGVVLPFGYGVQVLNFSCAQALRFASVAVLGGGALLFTVVRLLNFAFPRWADHNP